ncbi:hypothetical protein ACFQZ4_13795 [Catellatospora coxensis]
MAAYRLPGRRHAPGSVRVPRRDGIDPPHLSSPVPRPDRVYRCQNCGRSPAAPVSFRAHRGLILVMRFFKESGIFCRTCGLAVFRTMTSRTLVQGWWGWWSFVITPAILLYNLFDRAKLNKLTEPVPAPGGMLGAPWDPGKPLHRRATIAGLLVPLTVVGAFGYGIVSSGTAASKVGRCVVSAGRDETEFVDCAEPNEGMVTRVVDRTDLCPSGTIDIVEGYTYQRGRVTDTYFYCIGPDLS